MDLDAMAREALRGYGVPDADIMFLRHNENAVYRVDMPDGRRYSLRLHVPAEALNKQSLMQRREWIEGEMQFIQALNLESEVKVQSPLVTRDGDLVCRLANEELATILSWLPGDTFNPKAEDAEACARKVGEMTAQMHAFVSAHPELDGLSRPSYDGKRMDSTAQALEPGVAMGLYGQDTYCTLSDCCMAISVMMDDAMRTNGAHGLTHSDLGLGNLIVHGGEVSPIDFSLCGYAPFLFDVGGLMGTFDAPVLRRAVLAGYVSQRPLEAPDYRTIEGCFLTGILLFMALHLRNPHVREWFSRRLPVVVATYVEPFLCGVPFLHLLLNEEKR